MLETVDVQAADGDARAGDRQAVGLPEPAVDLAAVQLDQRRAGVTWLRQAVDQHRAGDRGQSRERTIVCTPEPGISKSIVLVAPAAALESRIAWRSEPGPLSSVLLTRKRGQEGSVLHDVEAGPVAEPSSR